MRISAKTEYACIAMLELASRYGGEPVRIRQIAQRHGIPPRFLVQILLQLKGAGLVASVRGAAGGYQLLRSPKEISLGQVMAVVDGSAEEDVAPSGAAPESSAARVLGQTWREVAAVEQRMLNAITLIDLLERAREQGEPMYHI